jgi:hypothetical protein
MIWLIARNYCLMTHTVIEGGKAFPRSSFACSVGRSYWANFFYIHPSSSLCPVIFRIRPKPCEVDLVALPRWFSKVRGCNITGCVSTAFSMLTYGWDADVLGGILEIPEFQTAMGASFLKSRYRWREPHSCCRCLDDNPNNDSSLRFSSHHGWAAFLWRLLACYKVREAG